MLRIALPLALFAPFGLAPLGTPLVPIGSDDTAGTQEGAPSSTIHRLVLVEQLVANGADETYWLSSTEALLERGPGANHPIEFGFDFERFEAKIGGEPETSLRVQSGHNRLSIGENPAEQELVMAGDLAVVGFLNGVLGRMDEKLERGEQWSERVRVFDDSVLPNFQTGEVLADFTSRVVPVGRSVLHLLQFTTDPLTFRTYGSTVEVRYRGAALIDQERSMAFHTLFEQKGVVTAASGATTDMTHTAAMFLEDMGGEPVIAIDDVDEFEEIYTDYKFYGEPELADLYPHLADARPRPEWMVTTWLAGRIANGALGGVAESSVNPVPTLALGSVVLTDQSIAYAGNILLDRRAVEAGLKTEDDIDINDGEYTSPLQNALAPEGSDPLPMNERLSLLGPGFVGAARIGDLEDAAAVVVPFGMLYAAAEAFLGSSSRLAPILSAGPSVAVPATAVVTATTTTVLTTTALVVGGAALVGGGVAVAENSSSSSTTSDPGGGGPPVPVNEQALPCNTSVVSGGEGQTSTRHELGATAGSVTIVFEPGDNIADEIQVFYDGQLVADSGGPQTGTQNVLFQFAPINDVTEIVVVVNGGVASFWSYTVQCPQ